MKGTHLYKDYHIRFHSHYHGFTSERFKRTWTSTHKSEVLKETGLLRAAALNLRFGAVPQLPPQRRAAGLSE